MLRPLVRAVLLASLLAACRRVPAPAPPAPPAPGAHTIELGPTAGIDAGSVGGALAEMSRRLSDLDTRLALAEATSGRRSDSGGVAGPAGSTGPTGPTGAAGPPGPAGPPVRLVGAPDKHEIYRRRTEQTLEAGETGAAVAQCDGTNDPLVSGSCLAEPAALGALVQVGAHALEDPRTAAAWRCEYRNGSPRRRLTIRAEAYCVARSKGRADRSSGQ